MISNNALNRRRKSSKFFDSPSSLINQNNYNTHLNLVQLAQLQRLQKLKQLHNTIPKLNFLLNKSNEKQQIKSENLKKQTSLKDANISNKVSFSERKYNDFNF